MGKYFGQQAKEFRKDTTAICRNEHLTGVNEHCMPKAFQIDGTLVAFVNFIGMHQGIDYALDINDLNK